MELSEYDYSILLDKFNKLYDCNNEKKKLGVHDYSLINALLKRTDEVNLHSNFIYSMINPRASHYCGNIFLKFFLKSIEEANFINIDNARVHKEKGKIDLLIEDGENIIIIENKLKAPDQEHQISRYIQYVFDKYLKKTDLINDRIRIVYLSEYKKIPSKEKNSTVGFDELDNKSKKLIWQDNNITLCNGNILDLPINTRLKFNRVQHSIELLKWVELTKTWLTTNKPSNSSLVYAFDEYQLILKRLNTKKQWRNLMSLDEYTLGLEEEEQKKMYVFMRKSNDILNDFLGKKLFREIDKLFQNYPQNICVINGKQLKEFDELSCKKWFKKWKTKDKYRDVGFEADINNEKYILALGVDNISFGKCIQNNQRNSNCFKDNIVSDRAQDIFYTISEIKKKLP